MIGGRLAFALLLFINILQGCGQGAPALKNQQKTAIPTLAVTASEDLSLCQFSQGPCRVSVNDIELVIELKPANAPSETPLQFRLSSDKPIENLSIKLEGRDMFMGVIPVRVTAIDRGMFSGDFIYGSCSSHYMVWRAFISFTVHGEPKIAFIDFLADSE